MERQRDRQTDELRDQDRQMDRQTGEQTLDLYWGAGTGAAFAFDDAPTPRKLPRFNVRHADTRTHTYTHTHTHTLGWESELCKLWQIRGRE